MALVSNYVSLRKVGQNWVGLCPFHSEKTPSFTVSSSKHLFHCFGCGAGGDAIGFVMKMDGLSFPEAVRWLGEKAGIPVASSREDGPSSSDRMRETLYNINRDAADFFKSILLKDPSAGSARTYFAQRGILPQTMETFSLGYAPPGWDGIQTALRKKGWSPETMEAAGLIIPRPAEGKSGGGHYDRFRDRVIFPIFDLQARVIGFGGRLMGDGHPKYLNSPETPIFSKGAQLYALERAREEAARCGYLVVVEGYFDVITLHQAGVTSAVATLGTALTPSHIQRIQRFVSTVKLIFDSDAAGIRAALRTLDMIIPSPVSGEVVLLPSGEDPDLFIRNHGLEAFRQCLTQASRLLEFAVQQGLQDPQAGTIQGKLRIVDRILPVIAKVTRPVERGYYLKYLSETLGIEEGDLLSEMRRGKKWTPSGPGATKSSPPSERPKEEQILVHLLVHKPSLAGRVREAIGADQITDGCLRRIFQFLTETASGNPAPGNSFPGQDEGDPELRSLITALTLEEPDYDDPDRTLTDCIRMLRVKKIRQEMKTLENQIRSAEQSGDGLRVRSLQGRFLELKKMTIEVGG